MSHPSSDRLSPSSRTSSPRSPLQHSRGFIPSRYSPSAYFQLQQDYDQQSAEVERLRAALSERDRVVSDLKRNQDSFPSNRLSSEISIFATFTQSLLRQLTDARVLSPQDRKTLESSVGRFASLAQTDPPATKLTQFFDETHTFCQLLTEKVVRAGARAEPDVPSAASLRHTSEMERLKVQNQLYRVERRLDEATEANHLLSEQIKSEHFVVSQLAAKLFPDLSVGADEQLIRREARRIEALFDENRRAIQDLRTTLVDVESPLAQFAGRHELKFTQDAVVDLRTALDFADSALESRSESLKRLSARLQSSDDVDEMLSEIGRLQKCEAQLGEAKRAVADLRRENQELDGELESLATVSADNERKTTQNAALAEDLSRCKRQLSDATHEISVLKQQVAALSEQSSTLLADKSSADRLATRTMKDLNDAKAQLQTASRKHSDLSSQYSQLQGEVEALQDRLAAQTEQLRACQSELKAKTSSAETLTVTLQSANQQIAHLKSQLENRDRELDKLRASERELESVSRDNTTFLNEIQKQSLEIAQLSPLRTQVKKAATKNEELSRSLDELRATYESTRQQLKVYKSTAAEADDLRHKTAALEDALNSQIHDNSELKALTEQYAAAIASLTSESDTLKSRVAERIQRVGHLKQSVSELKGQLREELARNRELMAENEALREDSAELVKERASSRVSEKQRKSLSDELQGRLSELENQNKSLKVQLESQTAIIQDLRGENRKLRSTSSEVEREKRELESENRSLTGQLESKSKIIQNYDTQMKSLRETNRRLLKQEPKARSLEIEVTQLSSENRELHERLSKVSHLAETAKSQSTLAETKSLIIDDLNRQIKYLRSANEKLVARNTKLDEQLRASSGTSGNESRVVSELREENEGLALKVSDLEDQQESVDALKEENEQIGSELRTVEKENRHLKRQVERLQGDIAQQDIKVSSLKRQLRQQDVTELLEQKDEAMKQLRALVAQQERSLTALKSRGGQAELEPVILRIERALEEFMVDTVPASFQGGVAQRLQAILELINQIRQVFDDQKRSIDELTGMTTMQRGLIMKLTREASASK
jgi:chromosome segregation ATPase